MKFRLLSSILRYVATPVLAVAAFQIAEAVIGRESTMLAAAFIVGVCAGALIMDAAE